MGIAYRYYDKVYALSFCTCHKDKIAIELKTSIRMNTKIMKSLG